MSDATTWRVGTSDVVPADDVDAHDERGILWMWEPPSPRHLYTIGCDPTVGITGWQRDLRTQDDAATDNAAIEVFRKGAEGLDVQVAEWAAPVDAYDLARVLNVIGRLYGGADEDGQALVCIEVYPGPGLGTQRELISTYGYTRLPPWRYEDAMAPKLTSKYGWYSTRSTRRDLWIRGRHHINAGKVDIRSEWLVEEMADCTVDNFMAGTARAVTGAHDDRVVAMMIAIWFANEWGLSVEPVSTRVEDTSNQPSWQASDVSARAMYDEWDEKVARMLED